MKQDIKHIYLAGIGGTAMASLAGMLKEAGYEVSGSDSAVYPPMSTFLQSLDIPLYEGFSEENLKRHVPDLVVIGNVLSRGNVEVEYVLDQNLRYASMAETLKEFFIRGRRSIVVAGTHGKTTTTAMLAWMLSSAGRDPSFLLGGIAENFQSSFQIGGGSDFVVEGDEYDTAFFDKAPKFLHYLPRIAVVKNIEFDHADIYPDLEAIKLSFRRFVNIVPGDGLLIAGVDSPAVEEVLTNAQSRVATYGLEKGDWRAEELVATDEGMGFDVVLRGEVWYRFRIPLPGEFNVRNALSAIVAGDELGLSADEMQKALSGFRNVRRRLELRGEVAGIRIYDDFAHHPTAVRETLKGVRAQFPGRRIWAVFEPRSQTSRRSLFEKEFTAALGLADVAIVAPVHRPVDVDPTEILSPERIVQALERRGCRAHTFGAIDEILQFVAAEATDGDQVVIMSNGGFDNIHERLLERLNHTSASPSGQRDA